MTDLKSRALQVIEYLCSNYQPTELLVRRVFKYAHVANGSEHEEWLKDLNTVYETLVKQGEIK